MHQRRHGDLTGGRSLRRMQMPPVAAADRPPIGRVSPVFFATRPMQNERGRVGDGRGLAGRLPRLFRLEINTAVDAPLLRRSLLK